MVRILRQEERKAEHKRLQLLILTGASFGILVLAIVYSAFNILLMEKALQTEHSKLQRIENEYKNYKTTKTFVDKSDIELLSNLQNDKVFWTRILANIAQHLPRGYWTKQLKFDGSEIAVSGGGRSSNTFAVDIDRYINEIDANDYFSSIFKPSGLQLIKVVEGENGSGLTFEFSAEYKKQNAFSRKKR
ncbi:MAG: hypothetical protein GF398_12660 [Chitinivibrionales bacterium]|nr:hypothetical protein [Chitinivibrionales bacterium]